MPVIRCLRSRPGVDNVDMITEPGINEVIADCAGNPTDATTRPGHTRVAAARLASMVKHIGAPFVTLIADLWVVSD